MVKVLRWEFEDFDETGRKLKLINDPQYGDLDVVIEYPDGRQVNVILTIDGMEEMFNFLMDVMIRIDEGYAHR